MKNRFKSLVLEVVMLLVVIIVGVKIDARAATTVPYIFPGGDDSRWGKVNDDFSALGKAIDNIKLTPGPQGPQGPIGPIGPQGPAGSVGPMPAVKTIGSSATTYFTSIYSGNGGAGAQLLTISTTIPAPGNVLVTATGSVCINNHSLGSTDRVYLKLSETSGTLNGPGPFSIYRIDKSEPTYIDLQSCVPFSISDIFPETAAGPVNYYLNGAIDFTNPFIDQLQQLTFNIQYFPNTLP